MVLHCEGETDRSGKRKAERQKRGDRNINLGETDCETRIREKRERERDGRSAKEESVRE